MNTQQMLLALLIARCELLEHQAQYDALTGAYNRHALNTINLNSQTLVIAVDVIGLGETNNNYGHHEGDWRLKDVASRLKASVRQSDYVVRFGGDEFVIIVPNCSTTGLACILDRIAEIPSIYYGVNIGCGSINTLVRDAFGKVEEIKRLKKFNQTSTQ